MAIDSYINSGEQYILELEAKLSRMEQEIESLKNQNQAVNFTSVKEDILFPQEIVSKAFHDSQTAMIVSKFENGLCVDVNNTFLEILGFSREEIIGAISLELGIWVNPKDRQRGIDELIKRNGSVRDKECIFRKKTGEQICALYSVSLLDIKGEPHLIFSIVDITERKKAEEALSQTQKLFQQVFNNLPLPVIIRSANDGRIVEVNDAYMSRYNMSRQEFNQNPFINLEVWKAPQLFNEYIHIIKMDGCARNFEVEIYLPTAEIRTVLLSGVAINCQGEDCILSISNDISEIKKYQNELFRLDRLDIIGQMAASVAHEVRNPMTSIKGFLQLFKSEYRYSEDKEEMELMIEELDRVNDIITSFLSVAQKNTLDFKLHCLNDNISNLLPLIMADALKNDIYLETELANITKVMIDEGEFRQLLLNLARNAIQAMPQGGTLTFRTYEDFDGVNLVVKDEGKGIPTEVMEKLGTPFLTTKKNGTGLGMAVCFSIAERHNAKITVDTSPEGTSFKVTFPVVT